MTWRPALQTGDANVRKSPSSIATDNKTCTYTLDVEGEQVDLREGHAVFVPAGAEHRFVGYEHLSLLVVFERRPQAAGG